MRIAYHLRHRAARLGYDIRSDEVYSPERYGMSPASKYPNAIKAETVVLNAGVVRLDQDRRTNAVRQIDLNGLTQLVDFLIGQIRLASNPLKRLPT